MSLRKILLISVATSIFALAQYQKFQNPQDTQRKQSLLTEIFSYQLPLNKKDPKYFHLSGLFKPDPLQKGYPCLTDLFKQP